MPVYALGDRKPRIHPEAFVHPDAVVIGDVVVGPDANIWPGVVLRADMGRIEIGARTSVQDNSVLHTTPDFPTIAHDDCLIGHMVHLEGCTIEPFGLVGSGAVVLHRAVVRSNGLVAANATVLADQEVPSYAVAAGTPARIREGAVREGWIEEKVRTYVENGRRYRRELRLIQ